MREFLCIVFAEAFGSLVDGKVLGSPHLRHQRDFLIPWPLKACRRGKFRVVPADHGAVVQHLPNRGFSVPVCSEMKTHPHPLGVLGIDDGFVMPDLGKFKRLGMDVVVNAVWLAYFWAKQEGSQEAVTALEALILDWAKILYCCYV